MTILEHFRTTYPNAQLKPNGLPHICAKTLGYQVKCNKPTERNCVKCWNTDKENTNEKNND